MFSLTVRSSSRMRLRPIGASIHTVVDSLPRHGETPATTSMLCSRRMRHRLRRRGLTSSQSSTPIASPTSASAKPSPIVTSTQTSSPTQGETMTPTATLPPTVSATATSTAKPNGSVPLGCAGRPSSCGYPDSTNTGPEAGTSFVRVPADKRSGSGWTWSDNIDAVIVNGGGATLNGLDISGQVVIDAPNVTISNSRIAACGGSDDNDVVAVRYKSSDSAYRGSNARIIHNKIIGTPSGCSVRARSGVRDVYGEAPSTLVDGNDISGTGNGITTEYSATVVNNWVHDLRTHRR